MITHPSGMPQPPGYTRGGRARTPQPSDVYHDWSGADYYRPRDRAGRPSADCAGLRGRSGTLQPPRRPMEGRRTPVHRCRSLPVPPPTVGGRGRSPDTRLHGGPQADVPHPEVRGRWCSGGGRRCTVCLLLMFLWRYVSLRS